MGSLKFHEKINPGNAKACKRIVMLGRCWTSLGICLLMLFGVIFANSMSIAEVMPEDIRVGYYLGSFRSINQKDAELAIDIWLSQICRQSGMKFRMLSTNLFYKISDLILAINNQKVDIVGLTSFDFIMIRNKVQLEPALITMYENDYGNEYVLLVNKELNIHSLSQLKGKKIFIYISSTPIPFLWLDHLLKKQGLPGKDRFFSYYKEVDKPSQAILPVFFGQADACIVTRRGFETSSELNPQVHQKIAPLITSPLFADSLMLFRKSYNSDHKAIIIDTAINFNKYTQGKQVMTLFQITGFARFKESYLANVITLMQESGKLK